ncbi:MAG: cytochrome c biogenesis protein CcsA [Gemmatimonadaceae bacterium]
MIAIAHFVAVSCYIGAAALAATPFARSVPPSPPVRGVILLLAAGVLAHLFALSALARTSGVVPLTGLGPALSFAGLVLVLTLLAVELWARDVTLTLVVAPFAALPTAVGNLIGMRPALEPHGASGTWLVAHIALSFAGMAAFATAAAAGAMYLVERHELKSPRFAGIFGFFPPLDTLDRVNHVAALAGWIALTLGVILAAGYAMAFRQFDVLKILWALAAWAGVTAVALGRVVGGWRARRAAIASSATFAAVVILYIAIRVTGGHDGHFL